MKLISFFLVSFIFTVLVKEASFLKCYVCESESGGICDNPEEEYIQYCGPEDEPKDTSTTTVSEPTSESSSTDVSTSPIPSETTSTESSTDSSSSSNSPETTSTESSTDSSSSSNSPETTSTDFSTPSSTSSSPSETVSTESSTDSSTSPSSTETVSTESSTDSSITSSSTETVSTESSTDSPTSSSSTETASTESSTDSYITSSSTETATTESSTDSSTSPILSQIMDSESSDASLGPSNVLGSASSVPSLPPLRKRRSSVAQAADQLIRNYQLIDRNGQVNEDSYACFTFIYQDKSIRRGCVAISTQVDGCTAVRDKLDITDNTEGDCSVCLMDRCNRSTSVKMSFAVMSFLMIAKLIF